MNITDWPTVAELVGETLSDLSESLITTCPKARIEIYSWSNAHFHLSMGLEVTWNPSDPEVEVLALSFFCPPDYPPVETFMSYLLRGDGSFLDKGLRQEFLGIEVMGECTEYWAWVSETVEKGIRWCRAQEELMISVLRDYCGTVGLNPPGMSGVYRVDF